MQIKKVIELITRKIKEQFQSQANFARHQNMDKGLLNRFINSEDEAQNGQKIKILKILGVKNVKEVREIIIDI